MKRILSFFLFVFIINNVNAYDLTVAQDGSGNYTTVQAAINAAPTGLTAPYYIFIKNGKYKEKISIPSNKPFIYLIGESVANTILYYTDGASTSNGTGGTLGTAGSASIIINATDFTAQNITFENTFGDGSQAVAVEINADRAAFKNCRFMANQDTLYTKGSGAPRCYFKNCYIDGNIDFIFGNSIALFDSCTVYAKTRTTNGSSYMTAASTPPGQAYGYVFNNCTFPANTGGTQYYLGRPWQNSTGSSPLANNKVVYLNAIFGAGLILPAGWAVWDAGTDTTLIFDAEYQSKGFSGALADVGNRVTWSHQLTSGDLATYTKANMFGSWDPCAINATFCNDSARDIAVSNFKGTKGTTTSSFNWNISWGMPGITYTLYRAMDSMNSSNYTSIASVMSTTDTIVNYQLIDPVPPAGSIYYYYIVASKPGTASHTTDTVLISSAPTITATGVLGSFAQGLGTPSAAQIYTVSGVNLVDNVTITPPANFEVSADGTTWFNNASPLVLSPTAGALAATSISVRLNASALGTYSGNITNTTTGSGANSVNVPVSGTTADHLNVSKVLQQWPLDVDNNDSAAVRATFVNASVSVLNKLFVSNGTTVPTVPAYSGAFGQAFGASSNGDGTWSTAVGGPGGNLNRTFYDQFTVTPSGSNGLRVDSVILNADFYNSNSNSKLAIVYSLSGFASDSVDLPAASFASPILLNKNTTGTVDNYRLALNGGIGISVPNGQSLTLRFYYALGSSSAGRYGMLKNVIVMGDSSSIVPVTLVSLNAIAKNNAVQLNWRTTNEINSKNFIVERSTDGIHFTAIGTVDANNSLLTNNYSFTDNSALQGIVYYRLRQNDKNGFYKESQVVTVKIDGKSSVTIYPNPAKSYINLNYTSLSQSAFGKIISVDGRMMKKINLAKGSTQSTININNLSRGTYFIVITNANTTQTLKFVKQ